MTCAHRDRANTAPEADDVDRCRAVLQRPVPELPPPLSPQHLTPPPLVSAQACPRKEPLPDVPPIAIVVIPAVRPAMATGEPPKHITVPCS